MTTRDRVLIIVTVVAAIGSIAVAVVPSLPPLARIALLLLGTALLSLAWTLRRWHAALERAERYQRRSELLARAALELQRLEHGDAVFAALPALLVDGGHSGWANVRRVDADGTHRVVAETPPSAGPYELAERLADRVVRERRTVYLADADASGAFGRRAGTAGTVGTPIDRDGVVVAVLVARGAGGFTRGDREVVEAIARQAEEALVRLGALKGLEARRRTADGLARTGERLLLATDETTAARVALRFVVDGIDATSGAIVTIRGSTLAALAIAGRAPEGVLQRFEEGIAYRDGMLRDAWRERRPAFVGDASGMRPFGAGDGDGTGGEAGDDLGVRAMALVPVPDAAGETRAMLVLVDGTETRDWGDSERSLASSVATALGAALQRLQLERQLHELLDVVRTVAQSRDPDEAYARAVDAAVRLIPSAEAATLLVRDGNAFRYAAAHGYSLEDLQSLGDFTLHDELVWYRLGRDTFERGVPRRLRGPDIASSSAAGSRDDAQATTLRDTGRVDALRATICVPIVAAGEVLGTLNVDNLSLEEAFSDDEMNLAEAFGQQIGVIIRQTQARQALADAAITDAVTGLGNREGFNRRLATELARARRRDEPLHLVMMDLDGFKRINDELGHQIGDEALGRVADAMHGTLRADDGLFRWGGDEFALLLAGVDRDEAGAAAARHAAEVAALDIGGLRLSLSTGIASWPEDGEDAESLLRRADDLMYRGKHAQARDGVRDGVRGVVRGVVRDGTPEHDDEA